MWGVCSFVNIKLQERERTKMASAQSFDQPWYISLLGLAENFRTSNPPNIRLCIHCLQSIFNFSPPPHIEARTHLQLGNILMTHTKNIDLARSHLEKAVGCFDFPFGVATNIIVIILLQLCYICVFSLPPVVRPIFSDV